MGEKIKKRRLIYEVTPENDMKYRGPLSPRHFKIIGWAMLLIARSYARRHPAAQEQMAASLTWLLIAFVLILYSH